jgi:uncharacterized protein (TIGR03089 family)
MIGGVSPQILQILRRRVRSNGAEPLITYYDLSSGERTELSAISFRNWVDKTSNLMVDEYGVEPGDVVALPLAAEAPGHWVTFVWAAACWQVGAVAAVSESAVAPALRVLGPAQLRALSPADLADAGRTELLACSLHPLGLGFSEPLPSPLVDYSLEVRSQPDIHAAIPVDDDVTAWRDADRELSQRELTELDSGPAAQRALVETSDPWTTIRAGLLVPLLSGGSAVVVTGADRDRLDKIKIDERVTVPG